jgi:formylglycine-generating enzyme required for sulfatase activity
LFLFLASTLFLFAAPPCPAQTPTPTPGSADLNGNGQIDSEDLILFLQSWKETAGAASTSTPTDTPGSTGTDTPTATDTPSDTQTATETPSFTPTETPTDTPVNLPPYVISVPPDSVRLGKTYQYHMLVADPEGDDVAYHFLHAPEGMTISTAGEVLWTPTDILPATVDVQISDPVNSVTETWGIRVEDWHVGASVAVDAIVGGTAEVTDTASELYRTRLYFPPGALPEDATITISAATIGIDFYDSLRIAYLEGLPPVTGAVEIRLPVSSDLLASVTSPADLAIFVHDAVSGKWLTIENVTFTPASAKDRARDKNLAGDLLGAIGDALEGAAEVTIDRVAAFGRTLVRIGEGVGSAAKTAWEFADDMWFQPEEFVYYKGILWGSGKTLFVIHGCLGDPGDFDDVNDVAWSFRNDYDNIFFWQYKSALPIGSRPSLLERIPYQRSGKNLRIQFKQNYVSKSLNQLAPKGYGGGSTVNEGIPLPNLKALKWNFHCDIVVHSMGGLVARECLENQENQARLNAGVYVDDFVDNLVTLGTPHNGGFKQYLDSWYGKVLRTIARLPLNTPVNTLFTAIEFTMPGVIDLVDGFYPNFPYITARDFVDHLNEDRPADLHTQYWQVAGNLGSDNDGWVTLGSALYGADEETLTIHGKNHGQLHTEFHTNGAEPWVRQKLGLNSGPTPTYTVTSDVPTSTETPSPFPTSTASPTIVPSSGTIEMVTVPAGTFTMGRRDDGDDGTYGQANELPRHPVTLSAYQIGKFEVTNAQYAEVLNWAKGRGYLRDSSNGSYTGGNVYANGQFLIVVDWQYCDVTYSGGQFIPKTRDSGSMANHPVEAVSWCGSVAFCNWLSEKEGRSLCYNLSTWSLVNRFGGGYRLASEAEWERAAAWDGSKHWIYGFKSDTLTGRNRCNYYDGSSYVNPLGLSGFPYTSPIGWFNGINVSPNGNIQTVNSASQVGCYDMSGNVWEWCEDWYHTSYTGAPPDGSAWLTQDTNYPNRVLRGGNWRYDAYYCRSADRYSYNPDYGFDGFGFRVARTP